MAVDQVASEPLKTGAKRGAGTASVDAGEEPIIIDLGKKNRKQVRKLRKGKPCRLLSRVEETVEHLRASPEFGDGLRPIIIVVRQRQRRKGRRATKMFGLG